MKILGYLSLLFFFGFCGGEEIKKVPEVTASELMHHIEYLASDELEGRLTGSEGFIKAAEYIRNEFKEYGLQSFNGDYFQYFPFIFSQRLTDDNSFTLNSNGDEINLKVKEDYTPLSFSDDVTVSGGLVFAGYGISAADLNYDDYEGIDVKDKTVLVMRYHPESDNPHSDFEKYAAFRYKANTAKEKGASAIIFVNGHMPKDDDDKLMRLRYDGAPAVNIAAVQIKRSAADELFSKAGSDLKALQEKIDSNKKPSSFELENTSVSITTGVEEVKKEGINVVAYMEGSDPELKNEYIIIGAHFDHLGMGETGSLHRGEPDVHNGADDNASGTSGVLELAQKIASQKSDMRRSYIFIAFGGEELGLLGSSYFVNNPPVPLEQMTAMLNMDMIGRMNEEKSLVVHGTGTSTIWKDIINETNEKYNFKITMNDEGYGPSDHSSFYGKNIPVLFFFTGVHSDYHRPSDDADKINKEDIEKVVKKVYDVTAALDKKDSRPDYVNVPRKDTGRTMSFRVYVGTIPDYSSQVEGLKITGVTEGSPAQKSGLKGGDVIINFGGKKIANIYDYTYALGDFSPGEVIDVIVQRNNEEITLQLELGAR
jgi:aminopeptidase YwaD